VPCCGGLGVSGAGTVIAAFAYNTNLYLKAIILDGFHNTKEYSEKRGSNLQKSVLPKPTHKLQYLIHFMAKTTVEFI
jgi:hypothetical protein